MSSFEKKPKIITFPKNPDLEKQKLLDEAIANYKKMKLGVVNVEDLAKFEADLAGDESLNRTQEVLAAEKGFKGGVKKFFKGIRSSFLDAYDRTKERNKARKNIYESGDIFVNQKNTNDTEHKKVMGAVVERFISDHAEVIKTNRGENREVLEKNNPQIENVHQDILDLIKRYATKKISDADFIAKKNEIIQSIDHAYIKNVRFFADNFQEVAQAARTAIEHGAKIEELDTDLEIILGNAKNALTTEPKRNAFERIAHKLEQTKVGQIISPTTLGTAVAIASGIAATAGKFGTTGMNMVAFGSGVAVGSILHGLDEGHKIERERSQDAIERVRGKRFEFETKDNPQEEKPEKLEKRNSYVQFNYETIPAQSIISILDNIPYQLDTSGKEIIPIRNQQELFTIIKNLSNLDARVELNDTYKIDLIAYSHYSQVEIENTKIAISRARLRSALLRTPNLDQYLPNQTTLEDNLLQTKETIKNVLYNGSGDRVGIASKDESFKKYKQKEVLKKTTKAFVSGITLGAVLQEAQSWFSDRVQGVTETIFKGKSVDPNTVGQTMFEKLRGVISGGKSFIPMGTPHFDIIDHTPIGLPQEVSSSINPNGTYNFYHSSGRVIAEGLRLNVDPTTGTLDPNSVAELKKHGIETITKTITTASPASFPVTPEAYIKNHPGLFKEIIRDVWYHNNTSIFDQNELKLTLGGINGTGIDSSGNYILSAKEMLPGGSFNGGLSVDAQNAIASGKLVALFSLSDGTQNFAMSAPIDRFGNIVINPTSELGKAFFSISPSGQLDILGRFIEIAEPSGIVSGIEKMNILATAVGDGISIMSDEGLITEKTLTTTLSPELRDNWLAVPISRRDNLEEGFYKELKKRGEPEPDNIGEDDGDKGDGGSITDTPKPPKPDESEKKEGDNKPKPPITKEDPNFDDDYYYRRVLNNQSNGTLGTLDTQFEKDEEDNSTIESITPYTEYFSEESRERQMKEYALKMINEKIENGEGTDADLEMGIQLEKELYGTENNKTTIPEILKNIEINKNISIEEFSQIVSRPKNISEFFQLLSKLDKVGDYEIYSISYLAKGYIKNEIQEWALPNIPGLKEKLKQIKQLREEENKLLTIK